MWGRLGYPRRALRLHQAATVIESRFDGDVPGDYDALRSLPGVGDYTAAAVAGLRLPSARRRPRHQRPASARAGGRPASSFPPVAVTERRARAGRVGAPRRRRDRGALERRGDGARGPACLATGPRTAPAARSPTSANGASRAIRPTTGHRARGRRTPAPTASVVDGSLQCCARRRTEVAPRCRRPSLGRRRATRTSLGLPDRRRTRRQG